MRPLMFFGNPDSSFVTVAAFWVVFYAWIGTELWLGSRRRRLPAGATDHDAGSKWWLIGSIWASVAIGFWVALLFPGAAIRTGRVALFVVGLILILAGMALRFYSIRVLGIS